ncbi:hypothetical protein CY35_18G000700 [Sphagnum magellanicum]|nr:hypothetical protein CY35_18G000700 [Sphagnum magellanicum]
MITDRQSMDKSPSRDEHPCKEGPRCKQPSFTELAYGVVELADSCMKLPELAPARLIIRPLRLSSCTHTKQICKLNLHFQQFRPFEVRCFVCTERLMLTARSS